MYSWGLKLKSGISCSVDPEPAERDDQDSNPVIFISSSDIGWKRMEKVADCSSEQIRETIFRLGARTG